MFSLSGRPRPTKPNTELEKKTLLSRQQLHCSFLPLEIETFMLLKTGNENRGHLGKLGHKYALSIA